MNSDSSFKYETGGDNNIYIAFGTYTVDRNKVRLSYIPSRYDTSVFGVYQFKYSYKKEGTGPGIARVDTVSRPYVSYRRETVAGRPKEFIHKNRRLLFTKDGEAVKPKLFGYSRKRFFLFGSHYYNRRYFLIKIADKEKPAYGMEYLPGDYTLPFVRTFDTTLSSKE